MSKAIAAYNRVVGALESKLSEGVALLVLRVAFAGIFWRSGRTKIAEGSWITLSDTTKALFRDEYAGVPLPPDLAAVAATAAEHLFPILLLVGLATRLSAMALLGMTFIIQLFVFPDAWWPVHSLWVAMALILIARGGGLFSVDQLLTKGRRR
ncbi:DoxX family protein [Sphingomonas sp.]|uniref:DoxX family protein n=1 Tax=Sphingomonas sp. TaxID=28214 RepID=UPI00286A1BD7|nr:DoxX family protein [Sphingomonas sp.]